MMVMSLAEKDEDIRVGMVRSFGLIDNARPQLHDEVAALARDLAGTFAAVVTLTDKDRNWYSGSANHPEAEASRWMSLCTHALHEPLWVEDARADPRFCTNAYVAEAPHARFYAGVPIVVNGFPVGVLSVYDGAPRLMDEALLSHLKRLSIILADDLAQRHCSQSYMQCILSSADAHINCDNTGVISFWSEGAEALFGYTEAEAIGQPISLIVSATELERHGLAFQDWRNKQYAPLQRRVEMICRRHDGTPVDIELWISVMYERGTPYIHANIRDISGRKREAAALQAAKEQAEAANVAKSSFLANISHELRTPLHGSISGVELLRQSVLTESQHELVSIVHSSTSHLKSLIGDVLDLAWIESGQLQIADATMRLEDVFRHVRELSEVVAQDKGLELSVLVDGSARGPVRGDALRLQQVLTNLAANAVKFTHVGSVSVSVTRTNDGYRFAVRDTGIGFDEAQKSVIFGRFQQADDSITRRYGGTGLGLAISRDLVAAMGGVLECDSRPGEGAIFWFTLPLTETDSDQGDVVIAPTISVPAKVLVVDDNATNRKVAEVLLASVGAVVSCVADGQEAMEAFLGQDFDLILMDMMMPGMDGVEATDMIRRHEMTHGISRTPIIMLTANSLLDHIERSLAAGADLHLTKPIEPSALFAAMNGLLSARSIQEADLGGAVART